MKRLITAWKLIKGEIGYRKMNFILSVISVFIAISALTGSFMILRIHDYHTNQILQTKKEQLEQRMDSLQNETRKAMLELGFNIMILPQNQDVYEWYSKGYGNTFMPEQYVDKLEKSGLKVVRHFLPILQNRIEWEEKNMELLLIGRGEEVPGEVKPSQGPMVDSIAEGIIKLGYQLHTNLDVKEGEKVRLKGKQFIVDKCYDERGNKEDISAWVHLKDAQELNNKQGVINGILAMESFDFAEEDMEKLRSKISEILPGTQVIDRGNRAKARTQARLKVKKRAEQAIQSELQHRQNLREVREEIASVLRLVILIACGVWIVFLGLLNTRSRRAEIGILRAMGVPVKKILKVFLSKYFIAGIFGGVAGFFGGFLLGFIFSKFPEGSFLWNDLELSFLIWLIVLSVAGAAILSIVAGWIPALTAARQDPAEILHGE
ncbi:MAG: ABC transporter permease [bacterium]